MLLIPCNAQLYSSVFSQRLTTGCTVSYILKRKKVYDFYERSKSKKERGRWIEICWIFVLRMKHCLPRQDKSEMTTSLDSITVGI